MLIRTKLASTCIQQMGSWREDIECEHVLKVMNNSFTIIILKQLQNSSELEKLKQEIQFPAFSSATSGVRRQQ